MTCPYCNTEVEPDRRVSMGGAIFLSQLYIPYYYWIKGRHCPNCGHRLSKDELRIGGFEDPDRTWKLLSLVPIAVLALIGLASLGS